MTNAKPTLRKLACGALALATVAVGLPQSVDAHTYRHRVVRHTTYHHYASSCHDHRQRRGANGAIIGAIGGGIVGNAMAGGNRLPGTMLGAGVGALAGHAIGKNSTRC
jgi:outer membrane lipoprotein SlyB